MRKSERKTTAAVLRFLLDVKLDDDFCSLVGCSRDLWRKLENKDRRMTERTAARVEAATGVSRLWLLGGNPKAKPVAVDGGPWSAEYFASFEAKRRAGDGDLALAMNVTGWLPAFAAVASAAAKSGRLAELSVELDAFARSLLANYGANDATFESVLAQLRQGGDFTSWWAVEGWQGDLSALPAGAVASIHSYGTAAQVAKGERLEATHANGAKLVRVIKRKRTSAPRSSGGRKVGR